MSVGRFSDSFLLPQELAQSLHHNLCAEVAENEGHVGNVCMHTGACSLNWNDELGPGRALIIHIYSGSLLPPLHQLQWPTVRAQCVGLVVLVFSSAQPQGGWYLYLWPHRAPGSPACLSQLCAQLTSVVYVCVLLLEVSPGM